MTMVSSRLAVIVATIGIQPAGMVCVKHMLVICATFTIMVTAVLVGAPGMSVGYGSQGYYCDDDCESFHVKLITYLFVAKYNTVL